jgi:hypothetical protein
MPAKRTIGSVFAVGHTSNDNPFSESHFKTLKYQPTFPQRFGCIEDAKSLCRRASTRLQVLPQELHERLQRHRHLPPARII